MALLLRCVIRQKKQRKKADQINKTYSAQLSSKGQQMIDNKYALFRDRYHMHLASVEEHVAGAMSEDTTRYQQTIETLKKSSMKKTQQLKYCS